MRKTTVESFLKNVYPEPNTGCWIWAGYSKDGYGRITSNQGFVLAHRLSYYLFKGEFDRSLYVCHSCDNRWCVNPDHLFLGTVYDNIKDRHAKGRSARGESHHKAVLNEPDVVKIRELYASGNYTQLQISVMYNVTRSNIMCIVNRKSWVHI